MFRLLIILGVVLLKVIRHRAAIAIDANERIRALLPDRPDYRFIPVEFDPVRLARCLETEDEQTCRAIASDFEDFAGNLEYSTTNAQAMTPARYNILIGHESLSDYTPLLHLPPYPVVDHTALESLDVEWDLVSSTDYLFHVVRSRPLLAKASRFWRRYIMAENRALSILERFIKVCAYADLTRDICEMPSFREILNERPAEVHSHRLIGLRWRCGEGTDDWWNLSREVDQLGDEANPVTLRRLAMNTMWDLAADLPTEYRSIRAAAALLPMEYDPEGFEVCADSSEDEDECLELMLSFLDDLGLKKTRLLEREWRVHSAVIYTFFHIPNWQRFMNVRHDLISRAYSVTEELNGLLDFYKVPRIPNPNTHPSWDTYRLMNIFDVVNHLGPQRRRFWRDYVALENSDKFVPLVLMTILEGKLVNQLRSGLELLITLYPETDSWDWCPRLIKFREACNSFPETSEEILAVFTDEERQELTPILTSWKRPAEVMHYFRKTVERLLEFQYVHPDRAVTASECSVCLEHPIEAALTPCGHQFCKNCLYRWLSDKKSCPNCRQTLPLPS